MYLKVTRLTPPKELKRCPFCGAEAVLEERQNITHGGVTETYYSAVCIRSGCRASINYMGDNEPMLKVAELWNRRNNE